LQRKVSQISTSWSISSAQLQEAIDAGKILLRRHPCFQRLVADLGAPALAHLDDELKPLPPDISRLQLARANCRFKDDFVSTLEERPSSKGLSHKGKPRR
jgi:hypothetical protein